MPEHTDPAACNIYGIPAWSAWEKRRKADGDAWKNLEDTKRPARALASEPPYEVRSYRGLMDVIAFLSVMNKGLTLLLRGQMRDLEPIPTLAREHWSVPETDQQVCLAADRAYYWDTLPVVENAVHELVETHKVPRWRPFAYRRFAQWALIQHYELWPTPLLDFTSSLRVAASFAFALNDEREEAYLYVIGVKRVQSDVMDDDRRPDAYRGTWEAVRLNAVCPPDAQRPHAQEGFLLGRPDVTSANLDGASIADLLVARIKMTNRGGDTFWDHPGFPILRRATLLPSRLRDPFRNTLHAKLTWSIDPASGRAQVTV
jgi:hypothetical protein